jgi:hypothetical protein
MGSEIVNSIFVEIRGSLFKGDGFFLERDISWHVNLIFFSDIFILIGDQYQVLLQLSIIDTGLLLFQLLLIKLELRICHCKELFPFIKWS